MSVSISCLTTINLEIRFEVLCRRSWSVIFWTSALLTAPANHTRDDVGRAGSRRPAREQKGARSLGPALQSVPQKLDIAHTRATASPSPHPALAQRQCEHPVLAGLVGQPTHAIADW
jgi:hypothetical protein